jgi:hypothetical protein
LFHALGFLPNVEATRSMNPSERANAVLEAARSAKLAKFVTVKDIVEGNSRLNFAFMANVFAANPMLPALTDAYMDVVTHEQALEAKAAELETTKQKLSVVEHKAVEIQQHSDEAAREIAALRKENAELKAVGVGRSGGGREKVCSLPPSLVQFSLDGSLVFPLAPA